MAETKFFSLDELLTDVACLLERTTDLERQVRVIPDLQEKVARLERLMLDRDPGQRPPTFDIHFITPKQEKETRK